MVHGPTEGTCALLRNDSYADAFDKASHSALSTVTGEDRVALVKSQVKFAELAITSALNSCDKTNMLRARSRVHSLLKQFEGTSAGYCTEVASQMDDLITHLEGNENALKDVERVSKNRRAPVLRAYFYHQSCKLSEYTVKELMITHSACKETRALSHDYEVAQVGLKVLLGQMQGVLHQPLKLRIESLKPLLGSIGAKLTNVITRAANVKKHIGKSGCIITSDNIMNLDICISNLYTALSHIVCAGGIDTVVQFFGDMRNKTFTEFALHLDAIMASGLVAALDEVENITNLDCLSTYSMLPKASTQATTLAVSLVLTMMSAISKLMVGVQMGGRSLATIRPEELAHALHDGLQKESVDAKFVEVHLADALGAVSNVFRLY